MPTYTCLCCDHTETFESTDAALNGGWDVAPHFTLQPLCKKSPDERITLYEFQGKIVAERWQKHGPGRADGI